MRSQLWLCICVLPALTLVSAEAVAGSREAITEKQGLNLKDETIRINYSLGYQIGGDFKRQGVRMEPEAILQGIEDALKGKRPQLSQPEMYTVLRDLKSRIVKQQRQLKHDILLQKIAEDKKFLEQNKSRPGIKVTASGLQYKIIKPGTGKRPKATDTVTVNYRGTLTNKQEFDSSYNRGSATSFALNGVIKGWTEGLQLIREGGKIQLFVPPALGYGERGPLAHRVLIFDVELISVTSPGTQKSHEG